MKNYKIIRGLVTLILIMSLFACNNSNLEEKETTFQSDTQLDQNERAENVAREKAPTIIEEIAEIEKNNQDILDKKVVYVQYGSSYLPISYLSEDKIQLSGNNGIMTQNPLVEELSIDHATLVSLNEMFRDGSDPFESLGYFKEQSWTDGPMCKFVGQIGDWELFPNKVGFQKYDLENQPQNESWLNEIKDYLNLDNAKSPLYIKYVYTLDIDNDGLDDQVVNASNIQDFSLFIDRPVNKPFYESAITYSVTRIYWGDGSEPYIIGEESIVDFDTLNLNYQQEERESDRAEAFQLLYDPYSLNLDNPELEYYQYAVSFQYNELGEIMECPMYCDYEGWNTHDEIIFIDLDDDGISELITIYPGIYSTINVYKINKNREFKRIYSVMTPA